MPLHSITLQASFFETIAKGWLAEKEAFSALESFAFDDGMILVPGRRAARHLQEAFLRVLDGKAILLPRIAVLGDLEESAPIGAVEEILAVPPAVSRLQRTGILSALVKLFQEKTRQDQMNSAISAKRLWALAASLGELIDEADRAEISLKEAILKAQAESQDLAAHWADILAFLEIVTNAWPQWLADNGLLDPIQREVKILEILAEDFRKNPPNYRIWAVGFVDGSSGVGKFLSQIVRLEQGRVILRGVDENVPQKVWDHLPASHPQFLFKDLFARMGVKREDISPWSLPLARRDGSLLVEKAPVQISREDFWRAAFSPKMEMPMVRTAAGDVPAPLPPPAYSYLVEADDGQQEARAIALALRETIENSSKIAALVTPDRHLALRVSAALKRFGIHADDSAGAALGGTPAAVFMRLVVKAVKSHFAPVELLSLLKHPLTSLGMERVRCLSLTRLLEIELLRGAPVDHGFEGLRAKMSMLSDQDLTAGRQHELICFLDCLEEAFQPLMKAFSTVEKMEEGSAAVMLPALIQTAEKLSLTPENLGEPEGERHYRLWRGEDGQRLSAHLSELMDIVRDLPPQTLDGFDDFLAETMQGISITGLRNYLNGEEVSHPRVFILGILEARLLDFDLLVLGGMNEGVWPPLPNCGPWMGRLMRQAGGLFLPERRIGAFAQDFQSFACGTGTVIFSRTRSNADRPAIAASWLVRAQALMGKGKNFPLFKSLQWARLLDGSDHPKAALRPAARPPVRFRPRCLNVTSVALLMSTPYEIYARDILKLSPLPDLAEERDTIDFGNLVHDGLAVFFRQKTDAWQEGDRQKLLDVFEQRLAKSIYRDSLRFWWRPKLNEIACLVDEYENRLLQEEGGTILKRRIFPEIPMTYFFKENDFTLKGRADRVDLLQTDSGEVARILDYKTGSPPALKSVLDGTSPQLLLEGAVMVQGGFEGLPACEVDDLLYWQLKGSGKEKGKFLSLFKPYRGIDPQREAIKENMGSILEKLRRLMSAYDTEKTPYEANGREHPEYMLLARAAEWR